MDKTLYRAFQVAAVLAVLQTAPAGKAHALAVECAGCVAAIEQTTAAVQTGNATLEGIKAVLVTIQNHLNQIRLAVGPATTTATIGTLTQLPDYRNFSELSPSFDGLKLPKGTEIDMGDLGGLKKTMNDVLHIYSDAARLKKKLDGGKYLETARDIANVAQRRQTIYTRAIEGVLAQSYYALNQTQTAKTTELSLDQTRRSAGTVQAKVTNAAKIQIEILSRLNHLIALIAYQQSMEGARNLQGLDRTVVGEDELTPPPVGGNSQFIGKSQ